MKPSHPVELKRVLFYAFAVGTTAIAANAMATPAAFDDASTATRAARACLSLSSPDCGYRSTAPLLIDEANGVFIPTFGTGAEEPSMVRMAGGTFRATETMQRAQASPKPSVVARVDMGPLLGEPSTVALTFAGLACVLWFSRRRTRSDRPKTREAEPAAPRGIEQDALGPGP